MQRLIADQIVLIGRSNVGKSTLFRALTGRKVAVGRRPGVTVSPSRVMVGDIQYVDMPGFGFMRGATRSSQNMTKDFIVSYFETQRENILLAVQVIDAASFMEIANRWDSRGEVPVEVELHEFLIDLDLDVAVAANKMDRIKNPDEVLDAISERLGMLPPWRQWTDRLAPISAKKGEIAPLRRLIALRINRDWRV